MKKTIVAVSLFILPAFAIAADSAPLLSNHSGTKTSQFTASDKIYIEGICMPAALTTAKIYIMPDKNLISNTNLQDYSGGIETISIPGTGEIPRTPIWPAPYDGAFDVVIDTNNDLILQDYEIQCAIGVSNTGFQVGNIAPPPTPTPTPLPTVIATPTPAPTVAAIETTPSKPSDLFSSGEQITVKNLANVRKTPGGTLLGKQSDGAEGVIVGKPVSAYLGGTQYWFWNVDFDENPDGWVAESTIKPAPPTPSPTPTKEEVKKAEITPTPAAEQKPIENPSVAANEPVKEASVAQASGTATGNSLLGAFIVGLAIVIGFTIGSLIIARALKRT